MARLLVILLVLATALDAQTLDSETSDTPGEPQIFGRVLDATGQPVPHADVWIFGPALFCAHPPCFLNWMRQTTDALGNYTVPLASSRSYIITATAPPDWPAPNYNDGDRLGWAETFYPGVTDLAAAVGITAEVGSEVRNLDIKLAAVPVYDVRGRVLDSQGIPASGATVVIGDGAGPSRRQFTKADGSFAFAALPPGLYLISADYKPDRIAFYVNQPINVGRRDADLELRLTAPFQLAVEFRWQAPDGAPAPDLPGVSLIPDAPGIQFPGVWLRTPSDHHDDRGHTLDDVYPAAYRVFVSGDKPEPYYLDSILLGARDAATAPIDILSPEQPLTLTFKLDGGAVRGLVDQCGYAQVLLIPQDSALGPSFDRFTTCDDNNRFQITSVRPGEYYALAVASAERAWQAATHDSALLKQSTRVTVQANQPTTVDLRVIH